MKAITVLIVGLFLMGCASVNGKQIVLVEAGSAPSAPTDSQRRIAELENELAELTEWAELLQQREAEAVDARVATEAHYRDLNAGLLAQLQYEETAIWAHSNGALADGGGVTLREFRMAYYSIYWSCMTLRARDGAQTYAADKECKTLMDDDGMQQSAIVIVDDAETFGHASTMEFLLTKFLQD